MNVFITFSKVFSHVFLTYLDVFFLNFPPTFLHVCCASNVSSYRSPWCVSVALPVRVATRVCWQTVLGARRRRRVGLLRLALLCYRFVSVDDTLPVLFWRGFRVPRARTVTDRVTEYCLSLVLPAAQPAATRSGRISARPVHSEPAEPSSRTPLWTAALEYVCWELTEH